MNCPKCSFQDLPVPLHFRKTRQGMVVSHCHGCNGIWVTLKEIYSHSKITRALVKGLTGGLEPDRVSGLPSPKTGAPLQEYRFSQGALQLHYCPQGKGIWFPSGEFARLAKTDPGRFIQEIKERLAARREHETSSPENSHRHPDGLRRANGNIFCPKCGQKQKPGDVCIKCGIVFAKYLGWKKKEEEKPRESSEAPSPAIRNDNLDQVLNASRYLFIKQKKEWGEIITSFEQANKYEIYDEKNHFLGDILEQSGGMVSALTRNFGGSHRGFEISVRNNMGQWFLKFSREFYWFFSDMKVTTPEGREEGSVHRKFDWLNRFYELRDARGIQFASIRSPLWKPWTFPVFDIGGTEQAVINKKWSGFFKEAVSDADTFQIDFGSRPWTSQQRAVIFSAAISIDFDFFEENNSR